LRLQDRARNNVFAGDQFDLRMLATALSGDGGRHLRIGRCKVVVEKPGEVSRHPRSKGKRQDRTYFENSAIGGAESDEG
jgi:hypothetical protein